MRITPSLTRPISSVGEAGGRLGSVTDVDTDAVLVARLEAGDGDALMEILERFGSLVYGVAGRVTANASSAEDVAQEVFVELWRRPDRFDPSRGSLRAYLAVQARRRAIDMIRTTSRRAIRERNHVLDGALEGAGMLGPQPESEAERSLVCERVQEAMSQLPPEQRIVVEMAYFGGRTQREIAFELGIPEGTAKSRIRLAQSKLKSLLDRELVEFA